MLGLLKEQGITPKLHVYGTDDDKDVKIAHLIADREKFSLTHVDKTRFLPVDKNTYAEVVERNFRVFDGCPSDGIFDDGVDLRTRLERCAKGELMLNGGGGEIFRNFFYLQDSQFSIRQFLWSFYNRYDPRTCTKRFSESLYLSRLGEKINAVLDHNRPSLSRTEIEYLYPCFRCRYWMGKNSSINNRFSWAITPFIDFDVVRDALAIPLRYKNYGRFEAALIRAVDPALARYTSVYGHDFSGDPPLLRVLKDLTSILRPPILRRYTYRVQHRRPQPRPYQLGDQYLEVVLDRTFPYLSTFFRVPRINDLGAYRRICTLEYLFQRYGSNFD
jgi:asparagine synthase (glutamine-hydrolysing)